MVAYLPVGGAPFCLGRFRLPDGGACTGLGVDERVRVLDVEAPPIEQLLESWDAALDHLTELVKSPTGRWYDQEELRPMVPLLPGQVLQAGANYRKHVVDIVVSELDDDEQGRTPEQKRAFAEDIMDSRAAHGQPYVFLGSPRAMSGALDDIVLPAREGAKHDWELELGVVIGRRTRHVSRKDALDYVAGYTIVNDISSRDIIYRPDLKKIGTDWLAAKNSPTFLPTGPVIIPARFVKDPMDLRVTLRHNGAIRQDESTSDMIFDIPRLIEYCSHLVELWPGDLLLTGSPAGNGAHWGVFMSDGDVLDSEITGLGRQRNRCVAEAFSYQGADR